MAKSTKQPTTATAEGKAITSIAEPVRSPRASAGPCPQSERHTATRIYSTKGTVRHAVCDECGHTWKVTGERADPDKQYLAELAEVLDGAVAVTAGAEEVICIGVKVRCDIVKKLREIAGR